ncbi:MAG: hypothetical protein DRG24_06780 [Epsilonproteobacteria bacterium]|nr:MAG: hypothetical protein DRG24_06780 [Campylobacterota bacterium]
MLKRNIAIILSLLILGGCAGTSPEPKGDSIVNVAQDTCGNTEIIIKDIKGRKKPDGFMQVQVSGESNSDKYQRLEYRIVWFDKQGFTIDTILSKWMVVPAYAHQPFIINTISPSDKAKSFRIYIRNEKEMICDKQQNGLE